MPKFPAAQASMRPPLKGIIGPPHVDTANVAAMAMTSAPVQGKSLEMWKRRDGRVREIRMLG